MAMGVSLSFGCNEAVFSYEGGDLSLKLAGYSIDVFWCYCWRDNGVFICKEGTSFDRHWTWVEIIHRFKFWRSGEVQWPAPTAEEQRLWEAFKKATAENEAAKSP